MIVTLKWLNDFVNIKDLSLKDITDRFIEIGYEVEDIKQLSKGMERVIIGKIIKLSKHPNAERLQICTISLGGGKTVQILTAATNVYEGAMVPCALDGADLPNGVLIKTTNMRGEESQGMLCSGQELCINDSIYPTASVDGIMILDDSAKEGQPIAEFLGLDDVILDLKVLPNRPDCQSVRSLAKELAVGLGREFIEPNYTSERKGNDSVKVVVNTEACPLYFATVIKNVKIQPSPRIIQERLKAIGINPKNNIIDLTNYVLWEMGQPLHAFDYDKIADNTITVRPANKKEQIVCLDNKTYELGENITIIADRTKPIGIAGVMGGKDFSVCNETKNVLLECAIFDRVNIRRGSRSLGIRSDASARYERGVEPIFAELGMNRFLSLISEFNIGEICSTTQYGKINDTRREVILDLVNVNKTLGCEIEVDAILDILNNLDIDTQKSGDKVKCLIPVERADITMQNDLIEEIIRFYGYGNIVPTRCENTICTVGGMSDALKLEYDTENYLNALGASQIKTYTFRSPNELDKLLVAQNDALRNYVVIKNPLSYDYSIMRTQLIGSLLSVASLNEARRNPKIDIYEVGKVFTNNRDKNKDGLPEEKKVLAYLSANSNDFFKVKSMTELLANKWGVTFTYLPLDISFMHPNMTAKILIGNRQVGFIGKVHPQVIKNFDLKNEYYYFEINLDLLPPKKVKKVKPLNKYPASFRDLAVVVDKEILVGSLLDTIKKSGGAILESVEVFDIYEGSQILSKKKSVAFNLTFRKQDATLTQDEVNDAFDKILKQLEENYEAKIRA